MERTYITGLWVVEKVGNAWSAPHRGYAAAIEVCCDFPSEAAGEVVGHRADESRDDGEKVSLVGMLADARSSGYHCAKERIRIRAAHMAEPTSVAGDRTRNPKTSLLPLSQRTKASDGGRQSPEGGSPRGVSRTIHYTHPTESIVLGQEEGVHKTPLSKVGEV